MRYFCLILLLAAAPSASAQFAVGPVDASNGGGLLTGNAFSVYLAVGQAVVGTASNAHFTAALGVGVPRGGATSTGVEVAPDGGGQVPGAYRLDQNYPNPFNPATTIAFSLPQAGHVHLTVYNALGQQVAVLLSETRPAGRYEVRWDAVRLPSGIYFYRIAAEDFVAFRQMVLIK